MESASSSSSLMTSQVIGFGCPFPTMQITSLWQHPTTFISLRGESQHRRKKRFPAGNIKRVESYSQNINEQSIHSRTGEETGCSTPAKSATPFLRLPLTSSGRKFAN